MSEEQTLDPAPSSERSTKTHRRRHGKRKPRKAIMNKPMCLKGSTPDLRDDYFLTLEDDPKSRQDNFRTTWKEIGRHASRKLECPQDLAPLFNNLEEHVVHPPPEPTPYEDREISRTKQAT